MELIADNQPWLFRGIGNDFKVRTIFAQAVSRSGDYVAGIGELKKNSSGFEVINTKTLPKPGNLFNFSRFIDQAGKEKLIVMNENGYLTVYNAENIELWRSSDKFGGSETFFNYESVAQLRDKGDKNYWNFLEQRITALSDGTIIVPRNEGTAFSIGINRSYNKHSIFGLKWSGSLLTEAWHTRMTSSYLSDYAYDASLNEFVLLEVVLSAGLFKEGKTVISINKMQ
jgi:hypothetical protein